MGRRAFTVDDLLRRVAEEGDCWRWLGPTNNKGYGTQTFAGHNWLSHILFYALFNGDVPPIGLELDHTCRKRWCVNPEHLEPVTRSVNLRRSNLVGKAELSKTHCPKGHPYDFINTRIDRHGKRHCKACD